jgi:hypothetical protein
MPLTISTASDRPVRNIQEISRMPASTFPAGTSPATEPDLLAEETESAETTKPSRPVVALSSLAKERLKLLNRVLEQCVPKSAGASNANPNVAQWE